MDFPRDMVLRGVNKQTKGKNKMKKLGEGLTLQEFLKSLGLDDTETGQEREPAKIAPSGKEPMPKSEMSDIASAKIAPSGKEPLPKSELAKIKPTNNQNKINQPTNNQPSTTKPKVINKVINTNVDNSADTALNVNNINNNDINVVSRLRINNMSLVPARARVRVRDPRAYFKAWRVAKFGGDFNPIEEAVNEALRAFKPANLDSNRRVWLKIANRVGYENFLDAVFQQLSLFAEWESGEKRFYNKAAIFQRLLNKRFPLPKGGAQ